MTKRIAPNEQALREELTERMRGAPIGYRDGDRVVPVAYEVDCAQLVSDEEHRMRDALAGLDKRTRSACLSRLTHAMQSDDGVGLAFMTRNERATASYEWGKRLRDLVEAGKRRDAERERNRVLVDIQDED